MMKAIYLLAIYLGLFVSVGVCNEFQTLTHSARTPSEITIQIGVRPDLNGSRAAFRITDNMGNLIVGAGVEVISGTARLIVKDSSEPWHPLDLQTDNIAIRENIWSNAKFNNAYLKFYIEQGKPILVFFNGTRLKISEKKILTSDVRIENISSNNGLIKRYWRKTLNNSIYKDLASSFSQNLSTVKIADPSISYYDGLYYLQGTASGFGQKAIPCYVSKHLAKWRFDTTCTIYNENDIYPNFQKWAPVSIQRQEGMYVFFAQAYERRVGLRRTNLTEFALRGIGYTFIPRDQKGKLSNVRSSSNLLVDRSKSYYASRIDKNWRDIQIIDPDIFEVNIKNEKRTFLIWKERPILEDYATGLPIRSGYRNSILSIQEIELNNGKIYLKGSGPRKLAQSYLEYRGLDWPRDDSLGSWQGPLIENPSLILHKEKYYLFYSSHWYAQADYSTGLAVANATDKLGNLLPPNDPKVHFSRVFNSPVFASTFSNDLIGGTPSALGGMGPTRYVGAGGLSIFPIQKQDRHDEEFQYGAVFHSYEINRRTNFENLDRAIKRRPMIGKIYFDSANLPNIVPF
nr:hypothetical protein [uncultured Cohaesibacter sp.]